MTEIIAEVAQNHEGSLLVAHSYIDALLFTGVDTVKFQCHLAEYESSPQEPFRVRPSSQDATRYDYWKRMEFTAGQWKELADHATAAGLEFLCSPFSVEAVELLDPLVKRWKIASGEATNTPMIERIIETGKPVILSTGMVDDDQLDSLTCLFMDYDIDLTVLSCISKYPAPISEYKFDFDWPYKTGLSDHSGHIAPGIIAAYQGASIVEVHVTLSHYIKTLDDAASLDIDELRQLVDGIRVAEIMRTARPGKVSDNRILFTHSMAAARDLPAGHVLTPGDILSLKPGTGIPIDSYRDYIGRKLARPVTGREFFRIEDFE